MYTGGCNFVDHASGFIFVEHQMSLDSHETLKAKESFDRMCQNTGVTQREYLGSLPPSFLATLQTSNKSSDSLALALTITMALLSATFEPSWRFPESWCCIRQSTGRMLPIQLWPLAVKHAVFLVNHMPDPRTGLSPADIF
jgi:hypothetical protein